MAPGRAPPGWRQAAELPFVRPTERQAQHHVLSVGDLVFNDGAEIRERSTQLGHPRDDPLTPRGNGLGSVMAAIRTEKLAGDGQITLRQHFFRQAPGVGLELIR